MPLNATFSIIRFFNFEKTETFNLSYLTQNNSSIEFVNQVCGKNCEVEVNSLEEHTLTGNQLKETYLKNKK